MDPKLGVFTIIFLKVGAKTKVLKMQPDTGVLWPPLFWPLPFPGEPGWSEPLPHTAHLNPLRSSQLAPLPLRHPPNSALSGSRPPTQPSDSALLI